MKRLRDKRLAFDDERSQRNQIVSNHRLYSPATPYTKTARREKTGEVM
jgi:hypothetical protein